MVDRQFRRCRMVALTRRSSARLPAARTHRCEPPTIAPPCLVMTIPDTTPITDQPSSVAPYCWPLEPFDTAHPVRAYFNDPRIAGTSEAFHFGVDISAPNGTPVYAVEAGVVHLHDARSIAVATGADAFGYWHVVPVVKHLQPVAQHEL